MQLLIIIFFVDNSTTEVALRLFLCALNPFRTCETQKRDILAGRCPPPEDKQGRVVDAWRIVNGTEGIRVYTPDERSARSLDFISSLSR